MAKLGFYGGCFNPPTKAHIELAKKALEECSLDKVIFVPVGDLYQKEGMAKAIHRYNMLKIACKEEEKFQVLDIEVKSNKYYQAIDIFEILQNKHKEDENFFIMGSDNLKKMPFWKESNRLLTEFNYIILDRGLKETKNIIESNDILKKNKHRFTIISNEEFIECSSTDIRNHIVDRKKPQNLDNNVYNYIKENNIYLEIKELKKDQ